MKIVAVIKTETHGKFGQGLVEMSVVELANLAGCRFSTATLGVERDGAIIDVEVRDVVPGDKIEVTTLYGRATVITDEYEDIKRRLTGTKSAITQLQNTMKETTSNE